MDGKETSVVGSRNKHKIRRREKRKGGQESAEDPLDLKGCPVGRKQFETIREIFRDYDKERRGSIHLKAFQTQVKEAQPFLKEFSSAMFDAADKNSNQEIDLVEFLQMYLPHLSRHHAKAMCGKWGGALYKEDRLERRRQQASAMDEEKARVVREAAERCVAGEVELAFETWCSEGKSSISFNTLRRRCPAIDPYVIGSWFHQHDQDANGRLSKNEFVTLFSSHYGGEGKDHLEQLARTLHAFNEKKHAGIEAA